MNLELCMPKKSAIYGEYLISQDDNGSISVLRKCDNVKASLRAIADAVGFSYDENWNIRQFGAKLIEHLPYEEVIIVRQIIGASVVGKSQNRTALGMMRAFLAMFPETTLDELYHRFSKENVCPDLGMDKLFFSLEELEAGRATGNPWFVNDGVAFTKAGEWLTLSDGQQIAFNKMWTAKSLELLKADMATSNIFGDVDVADKEERTGFRVTYEYEEVADTVLKLHRI